MATEAPARQGISPLRILAWVGALAIVVAAFWTLRGQWDRVASLATSLRPDWWLLAGSAALVGAAYAVLIWAWRVSLLDAGGSVSPGEGASIWFVSNLARYIPGALWQMGALAVLARRAGVNVSAATSAAVALTVINTLCGLVVMLALGAGVVAGWKFSPVQPIIAIGVLIALRWGGPPLIALAARWSGRTLQLPRLSTPMLVASIGGSAVAWVLYGVAFHLLVLGILPESQVALNTAIAIYTAAYLAGFLSLGPPAGLGVADGALIGLLVSTGSADSGTAAIIAAVTRLWRTVLEVAPGLVVLAIQASRAKRSP